MANRTGLSGIKIDDREVKYQFIRSSGPGGQNVNKVATAAQLRFDVVHCKSISDEIKGRIIRLAGNRINAQGILTIDARKYRTQESNKEDAYSRLMALISKASVKPKKRIATRPTKAAKLTRLQGKRLQSMKKSNRSKSIETD